MKLIPHIHTAEHEIEITDHPSMFGFDVIIKFKQDSIYVGSLKMFSNVTMIHWMHNVIGYSSKAISIRSCIHCNDIDYESYDVEYIIVEMATKLTIED